MSNEDITIHFTIIERTKADKTSELPKILILKVKPTMTINLVRGQLEKEIHNASKNNCTKLILAGKIIDDNATVDSLNLGPSTTLHAIITETPNPSSSTATNSKPQSSVNLPTGNINSHITDEAEENLRSVFYVFCKSECKKLQRGKLRVRCSKCKSDGIILETEPSSWSDVLSVPHLKCICLTNECENSLAEFFFKCFHCSENNLGVNNISVPLPNIKTNRDKSQCVVCGEIGNPLFHFLCAFGAHKTCVSCFQAYASISLLERRFHLSGGFGYTLRCPMSGCNGLVGDPHTFRLLGEKDYEKYQKFATESCLLGSDGVFCPQVDCGEGFLVDDTTDQIVLLVCPSCGHSFCRNCRLRATYCNCDKENGDTNSESGSSASPGTSKHQVDEEIKSVQLIQVVCKPCPRCKVKTEHNGGCHHMTCIQCGFNWCWLCLKEWTNECQWDHWFE